jgi:hypothetical protein
MQIVQRNRREFPEQRYGQAAYNALHEFRPELAREIVGTTLDPFYNDDVKPFFVHVEIKLKKEEA